MKGRWCAADLRPWDGGRPTLRNPKAHGWPEHGDRTEDRDTALRWALVYVDRLRDDTRRAQTGRGPRPQTVGAVVTAFLAHRERTTAFRTHASSHSALAVHLLPFLGADTPVPTIDRTLLQRWVDRLIEHGYEATTVAFYLATARTCFRWHSEGTFDPTRGVQVQRPGRVDVHTWSADEITTLREAADALDREPQRHGDPRLLRSYRIALECALATGGRVAELVALPWSAFREADATVRFTHQIAPTGHGLHPLKGKQARTALVLPSWWDFHDRLATGRVLLREGVEACSIYAPQRWVAALLNKAKLNADKVAWHSFRHTYARQFIEMGGRLEELQKSMGHTSIVTTEREYGHFSEDSAATLARQRIYRDGGLRLAGGSIAHTAAS